MLPHLDKCLSADTFVAEPSPRSLEGAVFTTVTTTGVPQLSSLTFNNPYCPTRTRPKAHMSSAEDDDETQRGLEGGNVKKRRVQRACDVCRRKKGIF